MDKSAKFLSVILELPFLLPMSALMDIFKRANGSSRFSGLKMKVKLNNVNKCILNNSWEHPA